MTSLLSIGCGPDWPKQKAEHLAKGIAAVSIDILPAFQPDYVRDIKRGLPFSDNTFDKIQIFHVLEHVQANEDYDFLWNEMFRVLKPGGSVDVEVPYARDDIAFEAAGHVRFFVENSFCNYYNNPYWQEMGQPKFELETSAVVESGRSGETPARVVRTTLKKPFV